MPGVEVAFDILENLNKLFARDGDMNLDSVDWMSEDPNYIREVLRPAVIKEDVRFMEQRKRVTLILKSAAFRRQLDSIIQDQMAIASRPPDTHPGLLQQQKLNKGASPLVSHGMSHTKNLTPAGLWPVAPINDVNNTKLSDSEKQARCRLASLCRIIDLHGWTSVSSAYHVSIRTRQNPGEILLNPIGFLNHEISASSLIKTNLKGDLIEPSTKSEHGTLVDLPELKLHLSVLNNSSHIRCIIHINTNSANAVSVQGKMFQLSRESIIIADKTLFLTSSLVSSTLDQITQELQRLMVSSSELRLIFIPGSGFLALGTGVEEAWFYASNAVLACDTQQSLSSLSPDDMWLPSEEECQQLRSSFMQQVGNNSQIESSVRSRSPSPGASWRVGEMEWEAMLRHLDNAGFRTGHAYHQQSRRRLIESGEVESPSAFRRNRDDVEIPACCVSTGGADVKVHEPHESPKADGDTSRTLPYWMTSPHQYALYELESTDDEGLDEDGDVLSSGAEQEPSEVRSDSASKKKKRKNRARWIAKGNYEPTSMIFRTTMSTLPQPASCTAAETEPNKFAPQGVNPKELKERQRTLKKKYFDDENTAGPSSQRLDGFSLEELMQLKRQGLAKISADGKRLILLAATSQAVIEKDARHFTPMLHGEFLASTNPFERVTDADLDLYRQEVEINQNPELARLIREQQEREEQERQLKEKQKQLRLVTSGDDEATMKAVVAQPAASAPGVRPPVGPQHRDTVGASATLPSTSSPPPTQTMKSDTSGVEDVEREGTDSDAVGKDKKKKRRFKMPSFSRKKKDSAK